MEDKTDRPQEPPLESWKAIAAHLKRDVRTVIRWEKAEGLPVHRQMHQARGSVFAYASELEAWKTSRELRLDKAPRPPVWRRAAEAAGLVIAVSLALGTAGGGPFVAPLRAASDDEGPGIVMRQITFPELERTPYAQLSPDGRRLLYVLPQRTERPADLLARSLSSGSEETVVAGFGEGGFPEDIEVTGPAWSPDGRAIAFSDARRLQVLYPGGDAPSTLVEAPAGSALGGTAWFSGIAWSPDGRRIAYLQREVPPKAGSRSEIWLVPAAGGTPRKAAVAPASHPLLSDVDWHPGGTKIFVTGGTGAGQVQASYQHWVMEGFLPAAR